MQNPSVGITIIGRHKSKERPLILALSPSDREREKDEDTSVAVCRWFALSIGLAGLLLLSGCETSGFSKLDEGKLPPPEPIVLREGDAVRITFPGAPNLNTVQQIKRDGRISLQLVGEVQTAGLTAKQLEEELLKLYGPQLQTKEVNVSIESAQFPVYVTGAVLHPGKIMPDRPMTALEAVMEAGGFDYAKANQKAVRIIRHENGQVQHYTLNLKEALESNDAEPFNLKPGDIVYVPERFSWF